MTELDDIFGDYYKTLISSDVLEKCKEIDTHFLIVVK